ncbi:DUF523 domain-containing protein [Candidatus Colwellia aromaticivorans]|uniref:DUF523 domain-containing protein n=1 Tax=Candidatus Colwellia aromaticivorans TaxID=2267621 RepID=UPI000DF2C823|nr:DUF523 domain-containing protein [Candidatus Colwellia aromaticivorans]
MFDKILISRCFLGDNVRYNNIVLTYVHPLIELWQQQKRFITICPEISGGLSVPREPAEIQQKTKEVRTKSGINVSAQFKFGAQQALTLCQQHNIRFALLKESSPSCGSTLIYDGSFSNNKVLGEGITSQLLTQHKIKVFSENTIERLEKLLDKAIC